MNNTALGAENKKEQTINFISESHEKFYYEKLKEVRYQDVYRKALCYCLGISDDTRRNVDSIYDFKTGCVKTECLHEGWQTSDRELYDELFEIICEVVCVKHRTVRIGGDEYPYELVKAKYLKLNSSHLNYVIDCMKNTTTKIANIKAYMVTTLYNAPNTINHYYQQEVQYDMYGGGWHEKGIV